MASNNSNKGSPKGLGTGSDKKNFDGLKSVAEMLNYMPKEDRDRLLANLAERNPEIAQNIKQKMFGFEDLVQLDGAGIQALLNKVPVELFRIALRTASQELKEKILANMSARAADLLREDLASQGPQRQSVVNSAQAQIAEIASQIFSVRR
ncbi:MAG: FliG C-terminal domain-containing protein [Bdellovibrionia bacterium]